MSFVIPSRLNAPDLLERIGEGVDKQGFLFFSPFSGKNSIIGKIKQNKFRLFKRRYYGNSFAPFCYGKVVPTSSGSEIIGDIKMHPFVTIFMTFWFCGTGFVALGILHQYFFENSRRLIDQAVAIPIGMIAFGGVLVYVGKWLARNEGPFIKEYLNKCAREGDLEILPMEAHPLIANKFWLFEFLIRRGLALAWDSIIPGIPYIVIMAISPGRKLLAGLSFLILWFLYDVITLKRFERGFGKKMAKLKVTPISSGALTNREITIRALVKTACLSPLYLLNQNYIVLTLSVGIFVVPYFFTKENLALHDMAAGTRVTFEI